MAQKKGGGSTRNGRDSKPKMLGVKAFGGELITAGSIIVRQRGTKFHPGDNVGVGKDHTLYALVDGHVSFAVKGALSKHGQCDGCLSPVTSTLEAPTCRGFVVSGGLCIVPSPSFPSLRCGLGLSGAHCFL